MLDFARPIKIKPEWLPEEVRAELEGRVSYTLSRAEKRNFRKRKKIAPSEAAERHRVLPESSRYSGPWRNSTTPYLAGVMDASFYPSVEDINICAAQQVGKTDGVNNCIGAYITEYAPGNVLYLFPDELTAKENSTDRIQPMFQDSPTLRRHLTGKADDVSATKIKLKHMTIHIGWASSAARMANKPVRYVVEDEVDLYPETVGKAGSPDDIVDKRQRTFKGRKKKWRMSSPTLKSGLIWQAMTGSDVIFNYHVKCPECGQHQVMIFDQIKFFDHRDPDKIQREHLARYECPGCKSLWDDSARDEAVQGGHWRSMGEGFTLETYLRSYKPRSIGFHIPAWLSRFVSLSECAAAFLKGTKSINKLIEFMNAYKAEPWEIKERVRKEDAILALRDERPRGVVPGGGKVACLTAGVDTQDYKFVYDIRAWGWGLERESWGIREGYAPTFEALRKILWEDEYLDSEGKKYPIKLVCQDAMGHRTAQVYNFCRKHRGKIFATQGKQTMAQPYTYSNIEYYPGTKKVIPGGIKMVRFDTNFYKNDLADMLAINPADPGAWHYHSETNMDWARQMTVEYIDEKGLWVCPESAVNDAWDASVLNILAHDILGVRFAKKQKPKVSTPKAAPAPQAERPSPSNWRENRGGERPGWLSR